MGKGNFYIVFPKSSSYDLKSDAEKEYVKDFAKKWYEKLKENGYKICCFAEDILAVKLLNDKQDIQWLSSIADSDKYFLNRYVIGIPAEYNIIKTAPADKTVIRMSRDKFKDTRKRGEDFTNEESQQKRLDLVTKRIRYVAEEVLKEAKFIVYLNSNNNYCKIPEPYIGDGKLIIENSTSNSRETIVYGGTLIAEEILEVILKGD